MVFSHGSKSIQSFVAGKNGLIRKLRRGKFKTKMFSKKFFKGKFSEFFLIAFGLIMAALGGYLISSQYWVSLFFSSFIINFLISRKKQDRILFGTSNPPPASDFSEGIIYMKYK